MNEVNRDGEILHSEEQKGFFNEFLNFHERRDFLFFFFLHCNKYSVFILFYIPLQIEYILRLFLYFRRKYTEIHSLLSIEL